MQLDVSTLVLLDEVSADGNGEGKKWAGTGEGTLHIFGTWDGATVTIQGSSDNVNYDTPAAAVYTADVIIPFSMGKGWVRAVVSSAGTTSLTARLLPPERP